MRHTLVTVLSVALSNVPAMAENPAPFHAVSQLSMEAEGGIRELDVAELAQVEGGNPLAAVGVLGGLLLAPAYAFGYYVVGPLLFGSQ